MDTDQEQAFIRAFVQPDRQERYRQLLANPKRRGKVLGEMYHTLAVVSERPIANRDNTPAQVEAVLRGRGARQTCYVLSPDPDLDGREMRLREALDALILPDGAGVACCVPGRLAYYKSEDGAYLLETQDPEG